MPANSTVPPLRSGDAPVLVAALFCETAVADRKTSKKSLLGIFDEIKCSRFPTQHVSSLYVRLIGIEGPLVMQLRFIERSTEAELVAGTVESEFSSRLRGQDYVIDLPPVLLQRPGRYECQITANGRFLGSALLDATPLETGIPRRQEVA